LTERSGALRSMVVRMAAQLRLPDLWQFELGGDAVFDRLHHAAARRL
jgi:hypothetical protein